MLRSHYNIRIEIDNGMNWVGDEWGLSITFFYMKDYCDVDLFYELTSRLETNLHTHLSNTLDLSVGKAQT